MFEVRVFCEDNNLQKVLWALDGLLVGMPAIVPVRNAQASSDKTKIKPIHEHRSTITERMLAVIREWPEKDITTQALTSLATKSGATGHSAKTIAVGLKKRGILSNVRRGLWKINTEESK